MIMVEFLLKVSCWKESWISSDIFRKLRPKDTLGFPSCESAARLRLLVFHRNANYNTFEVTNLEWEKFFAMTLPFLGEFWRPHWWVKLTFEAFGIVSLPFSRIIRQIPFFSDLSTVLLHCPLQIRLIIYSLFLMTWISYSVFLYANAASSVLKNEKKRCEQDGIEFIPSHLEMNESPVKKTRRIVQDAFHAFGMGAVDT